MSPASPMREIVMNKGLTTERIFTLIFSVTSISRTALVFVYEKQIPTRNVGND